MAQDNLTTRNIVPRMDHDGTLGTGEKHWENLYADRIDGINEYLAESTGYGIVSGCTPTISGLTVTVAAGVVHLADGTRKEISATTVTLDAADSTNPRIDLVYITSAGEVAKVTGTAAASPVVPTLPTGGIGVCTVSVAANATTGTIADMRDMLPRYYNAGIVNVKDFGAVGDGLHDDTAAIQAAIDYVGCATYTEYQNNIKGGTLYIPRGKYRITSPIYINPQTRVIGDGNKQVWANYVTRGENAGTNIICDFEDTEQYAVNIVGWVTSTGERDSNLYRIGASVDNGTITECQNVSLENISIIANSTIALGVHCVAASFLKIDKVSILGFRNGMMVSASWPVHVSESLILAYHVGLALGFDVNGGCVSNSYINKIGDMEYTVDNRIIHYDEHGEEDPLARTGIYTTYLNAVTFENVITEHWDRAYRIGASTGICINAPYIESIRDRCFSLYGTDFVINAAKVQCPNADFMRAVESCYGCINGLGDGAVYNELIKSDGYCQITFNAILTKSTQKRVGGIQLFSNHDFYVDSADGKDEYAGTSTSPLKTIKKALSLANDGSKIYLKRGRTFTDVGQDNSIYVTKNVDIDAYGTGNNPTIQMDAPNLYLQGFMLVNNKISFNNIDITVVGRAYNADAKSVLHLVGLVDINFTNCNIDIKSGTALIQPRLNQMAITNLYFGGTTITGNGALGANVSGGLFKIIDAKNATTSIATDIINNGYGSNAVVISSSIV